MTHAVAYHRPLVSSFGDGFEAVTTDRQVEIAFGSKRFHFAMRSSRLSRSARAVGNEQRGSLLWRAMGYVGCASLALGVVVVSGSMLRASPPVEPYAVVMPIDAKAAPVASKHKVKPRPTVRVRPMITPLAPVADDWSLTPTADADDTAVGVARSNPDVATLPSVNGERAVAVYGPTRIMGGKACRDVNVFVRDVEGKVSTSPTTECKAR